MIKKLLIAACLTLPFAAFAAEDKKPTAQQNRMTVCNKEAGAKALKGDERKKFMQECLSAEAKPSAAKGAQQEKMVACNKQAGDKALKGAERKKFMSACLKG